MPKFLSVGKTVQLIIALYDENISYFCYLETYNNLKYPPPNFTNYQLMTVHFHMSFLLPFLLSWAITDNKMGIYMIISINSLEEKTNYQHID